MLIRILTFRLFDIEGSDAGNSDTESDDTDTTQGFWLSNTSQIKWLIRVIYKYGTSKFMDDELFVNHSQILRESMDKGHNQNVYTIYA